MRSQPRSWCPDTVMMQGCMLLRYERQHEVHTWMLVSRRRAESGSWLLPAPSRKAGLWWGKPMTWPTCCAREEPCWSLLEDCQCGSVLCVSELSPARACRLRHGTADMHGRRRRAAEVRAYPSIIELSRLVIQSNPEGKYMPVWWSACMGHSSHWVLVTDGGAHADGGDTPGEQSQSCVGCASPEPPCFATCSRTSWASKGSWRPSMLSFCSRLDMYRPCCSSESCSCLCACEESCKS